MDIKTITIIGRNSLSQAVQQVLTAGHFKVITFDLEQDYTAGAAESEVVLEFLPEDFELKSKVLHNCAAKCSEETILATTTANSWVTRLATKIENPGRFIGLNFVKNPVQEKLLVQIVKGLQTSPRTVENCAQWLEKTGVTPVKLEESPGFIIDRVMAAIVNEAALMYSTKLATIEDIDKMVKVCANWPLGPFEFADTVGIDNVVKVLDSLYQQFGPKYKPCLLLRKMVDAGWLGKKTSRGFYTYS